MSGTFHVIDSSHTWLRSRVAGCFDDQVCIQIIDVVENWRSGRNGLTVFSDVSGVDDYDIGARERVATWLRTIRNAFDEVHILVQSRTIAWAIKIVAVASGARIISYHSNADFEAAFARHTGTPPAQRAL